MFTTDDLHNIEKARRERRGDTPVFGYWGAEERTLETDQKLLKAANRLRLTEADVDLWTGSTHARHFMNGEPGTITQFEEELIDSLPRLRSHDLAYFAWCMSGGSRIHKLRPEHGTPRQIRFAVESRVKMLRAEADRLERSLAGQRW